MTAIADVEIAVSGRRRTAKRIVCRKRKCAARRDVRIARVCIVGMRKLDRIVDRQITGSRHQVGDFAGFRDHITRSVMREEFKLGILEPDREIFLNKPEIAETALKSGYVRIALLNLAVELCVIAIKLDSDLAKIVLRQGLRIPNTGHQDDRRTATAERSAAIIVLDHVNFFVINLEFRISANGHIAAAKLNVSGRSAEIDQTARKHKSVKLVGISTLSNNNLRTGTDRKGGIIKLVVTGRIEVVSDVLKAQRTVESNGLTARKRKVRSRPVAGHIDQPGITGTRNGIRKRLVADELNVKHSSIGETDGAATKACGVTGESDGAAVSDSNVTGITRVFSSNCQRNIARKRQIARS